MAKTKTIEVCKLAYNEHAARHGWPALPEAQLAELFSVIARYVEQQKGLILKETRQYWLNEIKRKRDAHK